VSETTNRITDDTNYLERKVGFTLDQEITSFTTLAGGLELGFDNLQIPFIPASNNNFSLDLFLSYNDGADDIVVFDNYINVDPSTDLITNEVDYFVVFFTGVGGVKFLALALNTHWPSVPTGDVVNGFTKFYTGRFNDQEIIP